jgi:hypothetical protein
LLKNFPHQVNAFLKLRGAVAVAARIGAGTLDDDTYGYELVAQGVYNFSNLNTPLAVRIARERQKRPSDQGAQTAARDIRRLLGLGGFLDRNTAAVTGQGHALLASAPGSADEAEVWREALLGITLDDGHGRTSHPVCALLRLLETYGPLPKDTLSLALEVADDSPAEFRRIGGFVLMTSDDRRQALGATAYGYANAVKILPALCSQAGLTSYQGTTYSITAVGRTLLAQRCGPAQAAAAPTHTPTAPPRRPARRQHVPGGTSRRWHDRPPRSGSTSGASRRAQTAEEAEATAALLAERSDRHEDVLEALVGQIDLVGWEAFEDPSSYDLLLVPADGVSALVLIEVKTLEADAAIQVRHAIGQLIVYRHIDVAAAYPDRDVEMIAAFDGPIPVPYANALDKVGIGAIGVRPDSLVELNETGARLLRSFYAEKAS